MRETEKQRHRQSKREKGVAVILLSITQNCPNVYVNTNICIFTMGDNTFCIQSESCNPLTYKYM